MFDVCTQRFCTNIHKYCFGSGRKKDSHYAHESRFKHLISTYSHIIYTNDILYTHMHVVSMPAVYAKWLHLCAKWLAVHAKWLAVHAKWLNVQSLRVPHSSVSKHLHILQKRGCSQLNVQSFTI